MKAKKHLLDKAKQDGDGEAYPLRDVKGSGVESDKKRVCELWDTVRGSRIAV